MLDIVEKCKAAVNAGVRAAQEIEGPMRDTSRAR
jgi:hypothetical protein